ncbi:hypothetical protein O6P43_029956 [Quillaja saponaria]|uniref:Uncharacterized protein n=1 Tax=Quillaja saponaria TaxID=32244 RepID=A0AAD7L127_QUISA|nr:hypothetical protein O6P43_029956 [Quillaja saponaria]
MIQRKSKFIFDAKYLLYEFDSKTSQQKLEDNRCPQARLSICGTNTETNASYNDNSTFDSQLVHSLQYMTISLGCKLSVHSD